MGYILTQKRHAGGTKTESIWIQHELSLQLGAQSITCNFECFFIFCQGKNRRVPQCTTLVWNKVVKVIPRKSNATSTHLNSCTSITMPCNLRLLLTILWTWYLLSVITSPLLCPFTLVTCSTLDFYCPVADVLGNRPHSDTHYSLRQVHAATELDTAISEEKRRAKGSVKSKIHGHRVGGYYPVIDEKGNTRGNAPSDRDFLVCGLS